MSAPSQTPPGGPAAERGDLRLPWDEQAERAVLGAVLLEPAALDPALEILNPEDFHREAHRRVFEAMVALSRRAEAIDAVTVCAEMDRQATLERAGGSAYVASLIDGLPRATNAAVYARIVHDRSLLRQTLHLADAMRAESSAAGRPAVEILDEAMQRFFRLQETGRRGGLVPVQSIAHDALRSIEEMAEKREAITGLATGYTKFDQMTAGLQGGDLIILAARPSMGKTTLALNMAQHAAVHERASVAIFSLEMAAKQLFYRLLCGEGRIDLYKLRTGRLSREEWDRLVAAFETYDRTRLYIDDSSAVTPMEIRAKARRLKAEHGLDLVVVDYLQLMRSERRVESRQQEISDISGAMKGLAKELNVPVIALSQLSRAPDQRQGDHKPQLSDLRESGAIEQDADVVLFIYRPEVYEKDEAKIVEKGLEGMAEIIVAKQRNGPTGFVPLYFVKQFTRFENRLDDIET